VCYQTQQALSICLNVKLVNSQHRDHALPAGALSGGIGTDLVVVLSYHLSLAKPHQLRAKEAGANTYGGYYFSN
jgi:hypothetical protein